MATYAVSVSPNPVESGEVATATITRSEPAPAGGISFTLSNPAPTDGASFPATATMPAGETTLTITGVAGQPGSAALVAQPSDSQSGGVSTSYDIVAFTSSVVDASGDPFVVPDQYRGRIVSAAVHGRPMELRLFTGTHVPGRSTTITDLPQPSFAGYAPVQLAETRNTQHVHAPGVYYAAEGPAIGFGDAAIRNDSASVQTIAGIYLVDISGDTAGFPAAVRRFASPVQLSPGMTLRLPVAWLSRSD